MNIVNSYQARTSGGICNNLVILHTGGIFTMNAKQKKLIRTCGIVGAVIIALFLVVKYVIAHKPYSYAGTLETTKVIISARVSSDISEFNVAEGDTVSSGQTLLTMTCDAYKILAQQIDNDYARADALVAKGHMSQAEYDVVARNKRDNDLKLSWCNVTSPIDGMVITKFREVGEIVAPGTTLVSLANPYDIWAYFYVPYDMLHKLNVGDDVVGTLPEANGKKFAGKIIKINEQAEFTPKNVQTREERTRLVYGVKVKFENPDLTLKSGMTIESTLLNE